MQFSIVNLNSENILYLLPSEKVLSSNETILSAAKLISIDQTNSYDKAKILYEWIFNNIILIEEDLESNETKNALEVFDSSSGTNIEINFLLSSLIRSLDIPSRIIERIDIEEIIYYQTEIYINGKWITTDIYNELINSENVKYSNFEYFNIYDQNYFDRFILEDTENYQILQY
ncbi:transglutaminase domain-containing protein [Clostridiaceae bacterium HSG29]|nr:transglutaminase domain-containing protein [Clostridiaceae bacterium HSG29]